MNKKWKSLFTKWERFVIFKEFLWSVSNLLDATFIRLFKYLICLVLAILKIKLPKMWRWYYSLAIRIHVLYKKKLSGQNHVRQIKWTWTFRTEPSKLFSPFLVPYRCQDRWISFLWKDLVVRMCSCKKY